MSPSPTSPCEDFEPQSTWPEYWTWLFSWATILRKRVANFFPFMFTALGMVPPPENVRMNSVNFKNILRWESPAFPKGNLTFTAQYQRQVWAALGRRAPKDGGLGRAGHWAGPRREPDCCHPSDCNSPGRAFLLAFFILSQNSCESSVPWKQTVKSFLLFLVMVHGVTDILAYRLWVSSATKAACCNVNLSGLSLLMFFKRKMPMMRPSSSY